MTVTSPMVWTPRRVLAAAAEDFGVTTDDLLSKSRTQPLIRYRQVTYAAVKRFCQLSYSSTARVFGRDHSSVMHSIDRVETDPELSAMFILLAERLLREGVG